MSRVKYNFNFDGSDYAKQLTTEMDINFFRVLKEAATGVADPIDKNNIIESINRALRIINTPEYIFVANPKYKDEFDEFFKKHRDICVKVLYSKEVEENKFIAIKNDAAHLEYYYPENNFIPISYTTKILHPDHIIIYNVE